MPRCELIFTSTIAYDNPLQDTSLQVTILSPSGSARTIDGFWDGDTTWRARFLADEQGTWSYTTTCSDPANTGLHSQSGTLVYEAPAPATRFEQHGPLRVSDNRRYLVHADGTPFLWLGDTAWNGPLRATSAEWEFYLQERVRQGFTAVQWVTTQWRTAPDGDREGQMAFTGHERIQVNPSFFQRLDAMQDAINRAGLLSIPVLLWAIKGDENPGYTLPEDQAILLERYMVARWQANDVVWILNGDGDYRGANAERWRRIGQAVFGDAPHAPVVLHPGGMHWVLEEFRNEPWLDLIGYQSGHGDSPDTLRWLIAGPPATDWKSDPPRPYINLEPPYEDHIAYQSKLPIDALTVRRAIYWSLLVTPTAGVTYGGHGVWGWDDGSGPPVAHPNTGTPKPWQEALLLPAAEQIAHVSACFNAIEWWRLRPAPELLAAQPGDFIPSRFIAAARSEHGDLALIYIPEERAIALYREQLQPEVTATWFNPRTGEYTAATIESDQQLFHFQTPAEGDWVLLLR